MVARINTDLNNFYKYSGYLLGSTRERERNSKRGRVTCDCVCKDTCVCVKTDMFVKRPDENENSAGLLSFKSRNNFRKYPIFTKSIEVYKNNIKHTIEHKFVYAKVERDLYGKNTINSLTHDFDKLLLYILGFSHEFVSKTHRKISEHHIESGKPLNLTSMLCDHIASSPFFKPEKKLSVREFYSASPELQNIEGFGEILEKYCYGENIDLKQIDIEKQKYINKLHNMKAIFSA